MKYAPGSSSKNFAWHGTGLRKLYRAIGAGFQKTLKPIDRQAFRAECGKLDAIDLIPINFFLHNKGGSISVDELVFQAIERPHSLRFDRLALFAFNLNRAGGGRDSRSGRKIVPRPAMWANEFVRELLWEDGAWKSAALEDSILDAFISDRMNALPHVQRKCRNNYRHMYELCNYLPSKLPIINSSAEQWLSSALFLAWDRHVLDGGTSAKGALIELVERDQLYRLVGVSGEFVRLQADHLAELCLDVGGLDRFLQGVITRKPTKARPEDDSPHIGEPANAVLEVKIYDEESTEWIDQEESDRIVERTTIQRYEQRRDRKKAAALKKHYANACMFCDERIQVGADLFYSEAAHIKPLGMPHNGPDKASNMLVLCPNHHIQFDRGVLRLERAAASYRITSRDSEHPLHGKIVQPLHKLDDSCVGWHRDWFGVKRAY